MCVRSGRVRVQLLVEVEADLQQDVGDGDKDIMQTKPDSKKNTKRLQIVEGYNVCRSDQLRAGLSNIEGSIDSRASRA